MEETRDIAATFRDYYSKNLKLLNESEYVITTSIKDSKDVAAAFRDYYSKNLKSINELERIENIKDAFKQFYHSRQYLEFNFDENFSDGVSEEDNLVSKIKVKDDKCLATSSLSIKERELFILRQVSDGTLSINDINNDSIRKKAEDFLQLSRSKIEINSDDILSTNKMQVETTKFRENINDCASLVEDLSMENLDDVNLVEDPKNSISIYKKDDILVPKNDTQSQPYNLFSFIKEIFFSLLSLIGIYKDS